MIKQTTITQVEGAFKKNIESSLPYTEVVSRQAFDMTDVMMALSIILHHLEDSARKTLRHRCIDAVICFVHILANFVCYSHAVIRNNSYKAAI